MSDPPLRSIEADRARRAAGIARFFGTAPVEVPAGTSTPEPAPRYGLQQGYRSGGVPLPVDANERFREMIRRELGEG